MDAFTRLTGIAAPMDQINVDTDQLTPARFIGGGRRGGSMGDILLHDHRFTEDGSEKPDFVLNQEPFRHAKILVADTNFGCGSSRESAVTALYAYGFRSVIAPSFGDIFHSNAAKNGLLAVCLDAPTCASIRAALHASPGAEITIDLESQTVTDPGENKGIHHFEFDPFQKHCMLNGLDDIGLTLALDDEIKAHEARHRKEMSWLYRT